ncbi:dTDP-4-dehydrorhamnose reductase [Rariglobus hedericola]|uniref:dTDP-4-dehydrorhamnose reductase n=1 Tax=Rariglobus hedericola TaxID=2597822 RepID=A0A556QQP8_9BACT|nr:dTDP-4-dehydrorhamnose reductase [Rariglobus hedericola]TSJ78960.1 dTDP-4-dehydrorhamnose reductase [Rariglobus hedericola]
MRILITGAAGLLGNELVQSVQAKGWESIAASRVDWDLAKPEEAAYLIGKYKPDVTVHCAAETNVDKCELEPDWAKLINEDATAALAAAIQAAGSRLVYISSCGIFSGDSRVSYLETDIPKPRTIYAASKYHGELRVQETNPDFLVCRVGWLFGGSLTQKKNFVEARRKEALTGKPMMSANDKWGSPTWAKHAADRIVDLIDISAGGVAHVANAGVVSRHEYVCGILAALNSTATVQAVDSSNFKRAAPVPDFEAISSVRNKDWGMSPLPSWQEALADYVKIYAAIKTP